MTYRHPRDSIKRRKLGSAYTAQGLLPHTIQPVSASPYVMSLFHKVCATGNGPNYRRSLSWKQARLGGNASVVEKIVSTWARSLVQNFKSVDPWNDGYIVIVIARLICDSLRILFTSLFFVWSKIEVHFCLFIFHLDLFISVKILTIFYRNTN